MSLRSGVDASGSHQEASRTGPIYVYAGQWSVNEGEVDAVALHRPRQWLMSMAVTRKLVIRT